MFESLGSGRSAWDTRRFSVLAAPLLAHSKTELGQSSPRVGRQGRFVPPWSATGSRQLVHALTPNPGGTKERRGRGAGGGMGREKKGEDDDAGGAGFGSAGGVLLWSVRVNINYHGYN